MGNILCSDCPRRCGAIRRENEGEGVCRSGILPRLARAAPHIWEEPPISGKNGSGAVFFSGCNLRCVYCQNYKISSDNYGETVTPDKLRRIYFSLIEKGCHNISLITASHYIDAVIESLAGGLPVPVVYNTGGYDSVTALKRLEGKVQIYLPDMKYALPAPASRYSAAPDYPETAKLAIMEMYRQTGDYVIDENGLMKSGVIIRHLILPNNIENTFRVIDWVADTFPAGGVMFSLMSQYLPMGRARDFPEINRRITPEEYNAAVDYLDRSPIADGFWQELSSADGEFVPDFDLSGINF